VAWRNSKACQQRILSPRKVVPKRACNVQHRNDLLRHHVHHLSARLGEHPGICSRMIWVDDSALFLVRKKNGSSTKKLLRPILALGTQVVGFDVLPEPLGHLGWRNLLALLAPKNGRQMLVELNAIPPKITFLACRRVSPPRSDKERPSPSPRAEKFRLLLQSVPSA